MSRSYHRVYPSIWDEPWDDDTRHVALYLLTCRHRRMEGVYRLPWPYILADLGWTEKRLRAAWDELLAHGFIEYDEHPGVVWIVKALERQPPDNENQRKAVIKAVGDLPSCGVVERFKRVARTVHEQFVEGFPEQFVDSPAPTPAPQTATSSKLDQDGDRRTESVSAVSTADVRAVFEAWQAATGKQRAVLDSKRRRRIQNALKSYPVADLIDAVQGWKHSAHHRGENQAGTVFNDLDLLLRDADHIERFRDLNRGANGVRVGESSAEMVARRNARLELLDRESAA